jgi:hypothetical protein
LDINPSVRTEPLNIKFIWWQLYQCDVNFKCMYISE